LKRGVAGGEDNVASGYARPLTGGGETASDGQTVVGLKNTKTMIIKNQDGP
jgi:hypothetical protein